MKPGLKTLLSGIGLFIVGLLIGPVMIFAVVFSQGDKQLFLVPGDITVEVSTPGTYYLWNKYQTIYEGRTYNQPRELPDGMEFHITDARGNRLPFVSSANMSTTSGSYESVSVGYVKIEQPGPVHVEVFGSGEERVFSFAKSMVFKTVLLIGGGVLLAFLCAGGGVVMGIIGIVKMAQAPKPV